MSKINKELYHYMARVLKTVDGDTIKLQIDLGMRTYFVANCRMAHINTPEVTSKDPEIKAKADAAKEYLTQRLPVDTQIYIISRRLDNYGRPLIDVYLNEVNINQEMIDKGFAVPFM